MLQRAASNAYSWWWASHIRTKQSKWLEQNLQDMEEKVQATLKLIEEDGDSFAKRAEMYYKKRPELIHFVEESYRAYRSLAERYDRISTELQNANNTIAYVFPEQVQFAMDDDEDENSPRFLKKPGQGPKGERNIPKVPNIPIPKEIKGMFATAKKKFQPKKPSKKDAPKVSKSGLTKSEGLQEIEKLQKQILGLQTEKEFAKSSYEGGLAKYWEIHEQIRGLQDKVFTLQDEFGDGMVIEDEDARSLMASAALKSCRESLAQLQEKQEKSEKEAIVEQQRINETRERFKSLKIELKIDQDELQGENQSKRAEVDEKGLNQEPAGSTQQAQELDALREKIKEHFELGLNGPLTVTELAEKIDELVNKVISLESAVSSQNALIQTLRFETDDLQAQIQSLESDKSTLISGKNDLTDKIRKMEQKLLGIQDLNQNVADQNVNLQTHFTEAQCNLGRISEKLLDVNSNEEQQSTEGSFDKIGAVTEDGTKDSQLQTLDSVPKDAIKDSQLEKRDSVLNADNSINQSTSVRVLKDSDSSPKKDESSKLNQRSNSSPQKDESSPEQDESSKSSKDESADRTTGQDILEVQTSNGSDVENNSKVKLEGKGPRRGSSKKLVSYLLAESLEPDSKGEDEPDWKQMYMNSMEDKDKALLSEYTVVLRNYKEVKKKLDESEKRSNDSNSQFDMMVQLKELKSANVKKDEQIRLLREKISLLKAELKEGNESEKLTTIDSVLIETEPADGVKEIPKNQPESSTEIEEIPESDQQESSTAIEEKFRSNIDEVLEENLNFWLRFSSTFHQIQKFDTEVKDLKSDFLKIEKKQSKQEAGSSAKHYLRSDARALYRHLSEVHTELTVWLEKTILLKDELKSRFSCLCDIQDEITAALKESTEDSKSKFESYQAAKFQGELMNMKQENKKIDEEMQGGLDHVSALQLEVEQILAKINEDFKLSGSRHKQNFQLQPSSNRSRVPLHSFIFGGKPKKQRTSLFFLYPVLYRKYYTKSGPL